MACMAKIKIDNIYILNNKLYKMINVDFSHLSNFRIDGRTSDELRNTIA